MRSATLALVLVALAAGCLEFPSTQPMQPPPTPPVLPAEGDSLAWKRLALAESTAAPARELPQDPAPRPDELKSPEVERRSAPEHVKAAAQTFVEERLGEHARLATLDDDGSQRYSACPMAVMTCDDWGWTPYHKLVYGFDLPIGPHDVELLVTENGTVVTENPWLLPDCASVPRECEFPVTRDDAVSAARAAGLEEGVEPWDVTMRPHITYVWRGEAEALAVEPGAYGTYAWKVSSRLSDDGGRSVIVDANRPIVLLVDSWFENVLS